MSKVWKIAPGEHADDWKVFHQHGCIGLGWLTNDDYQRFATEDEVLQELAQQHGKNTRGKAAGPPG